MISVSPQPTLSLRCYLIASHGDNLGYVFVDVNHMLEWNNSQDLIQRRRTLFKKKSS